MPPKKLRKRQRTIGYSSTCRYAGGDTIAAPTRLAESRSAGNENTWATLVVKFPPENHTSVSMVVAAMLASATELEEGSVIPWRADDEYASQVIFDMISTRSALSGPRNESQRVEHL